MKEIVEKVNDWPFLRQLPALQDGFSLNLDLAEEVLKGKIIEFAH